MKKNSLATIIGIVVGGLAITATFGYVVDRPVWYRAEFLPVSEVVIELAAGDLHAKWVRADEQVQRRESRIRRNGGVTTMEEREELRWWKEQLLELERRLRALDNELRR